MTLLPVDVHDSLKNLQKVILRGLLKIVHEHLMQSACDIDRLAAQSSSCLFHVSTRTKEILNSIVLQCC